jgi:hypothetical protein
MRDDIYPRVRMSHISSQHEKFKVSSGDIHQSVGSDDDEELDKCCD